MAVADELRAIAERASCELDAVHDFFEHSKTVWRSFQIHVDEGHTVVSTNRATGTTIDQGGLIALAPLYTGKYLAAFTFRQFVSAFESFLFAFLHRVLVHNPWQFSRSQLDFEVVLKAADRADVIAGVIQKRLNELKYDQLREWFVALNRAVRLDGPTDDEIDALTEVKAARDVLEHNAGIVNDVYLRKAGRKARYAAGDPVEIDDPYHLASWRLIKKVVTDVTEGTIRRLAAP